MKTITYQNKTLHFVSTAHVSKASVEEVKAVIESTQPTAVCIELDANRAQSLLNPPTKTDTDIKTIIKQKKVAAFAANLILASYQKKMAQDLDTEVGQEMKQAITSAEAINARVVYIDRDITITLKRIWGNLNLWKRAELGSVLVSSLFAKDNVQEDDIEALKHSDLLFEAVKELDDKLPDVSKALLHERNHYMAEMIKRCPEDVIVIVIGAAHTQGILEALDQTHDLDALNTLPLKKKRPFSGWIIPGIIVVALVALTLKSPQMGLNQLLVWFGLSSTLSALGALLVGAHPLTILATFLGAPIGVLSPVLAVGMFSSLVEAYCRPPRVSDFSSLSEDASVVKKWFTNRALRLLLIFIVTNLLSSLGTFIAGGTIITQLLK